ncbi:unnamed protein product [Spirodela intermedia]|uniref:Uncharacterized protein n=1 Tax=Spirodela intermedia TaxID=51605 RepID=A0A7I8IR51_SPIIN|nr:unnamed protein product [Spirodela intermedia]CAA6659421.1 unnamed protein product [Spirodela intermedia]
MGIIFWISEDPTFLGKISLSTHMHHF